MSLTTVIVYNTRPVYTTQLNLYILAKKQLGIDIKNNTICNSIQKYEVLMVNLTKNWRSVHYKLQNILREITEDLNKWKDIPSSWVGIIIIFKMLALPKLIYRFNKKNPKQNFSIKTKFFIEIDKLILKAIMEMQRTHNSWSNIEN